MYQFGVARIAGASVLAKSEQKDNVHICPQNVSDMFESGQNQNACTDIDAADIGSYDIH
jgi:hypothetical protein